MAPSRSRTPPLPSRGIELVWEGKYDRRGRRIPPAPVPPDVRLNLDERYAKAGLPVENPPEWRNRLILGDNREALACLLPEFRGAVQLIYLDPPFASDADYAVTLRSTAAGPRSRSIAYRDRWGRGSSYVAFMGERLTLCRDLLTPSGCLFLHCDWHSNAPLRLLLDEIFGADRFVNEIVWYYYNKYSRGLHCLPRAHDTILVYGRSAAPALQPLRIQRPESRRQLVRRNVDGVLRNARDAQGRLMYRTVHDKKADDVWPIPQLQPASAEWTGYSTQKHPLLLERILELASRPGDLVADLFAGSGTTLAAAQRLNRRFVGCDLSLPAVHIAKRRLISAQEPRPGLDVYSVRGQRAPHSAAVMAAILDWLGAEPDAALGPLAGRVRNAVVRVHRDALPFSCREALHELKGVRARSEARLVCCAGEFEAGFWDALEGAGAAGCVLPVPIPKDALDLGTDLDAPPCLLPRARVAASVRGSTVRVTLAGYAAPALSDALAGKPADAEAGLKSVDLWAVDTGWRPGAPFHATWFAAQPSHFRWREPKPVSLKSPPLARTAQSSLLVKVWDGLGRGASCIVSADTLQATRA